MDSQRQNTIRLLWRIAAGALAVLALALAALRLYTLTVHGPPEGTGDLAPLLGIVFPFSLGLLFGYFAIIGKMPGKNEK